MENGTNFFDPAGGGDPILYQHVLWFFGHPEIYGVLVKCVLLAIGFVWAARALLRLGRIGWLIVFVMASMCLLAWYVVAVQFAHNSFQSGLQPSAWVVRPPFIISNVLSLAVPVVALFAYRKQISKNLAGSLYLISLAAFLVAGTLMGNMLSRGSVDTALHDTYYVVAHMRYVTVLALIFTALSLFYFGFRKLFGVEYNRWLGTAQWASWTAGTALIFFPQHFTGVRGMPRRYVDYSEAYTGWETATLWGYGLWLASLALLVSVVIEAVRRRPRNSEPAAN